MKLKRIFMTGVLASSMLALAACGDDVEGKPAEEKEKEVDPVQPGEPEEKPLTLSEALTALNNFSIEEYLQKLVNDYTGENSYVNITTSSKDYEYDKSTDKAPSKTYESNGNYIVTLDDATKIYGSSNPAFTIDYYGLKNNESAPAWTTRPTFQTDATQSSGVGQYPIKAVNGVPINYDLGEITAGILNITPAQLTIKANDAVRQYYSDDPEFSYTCSKRTI